MLLRWLPWKFLIGRAARAYGVIDPVEVLARLRRFSQPSEVQEPIELLRAGIVFQSRGLINARVIQYNLDWIWPYWVERQFGPQDPSFVPRSFSFGHVNLTQRSWTAVGRADLPIYAIVDPRGLTTPLYDGWSLDFWLIDDEGDVLLPSKEKHVDQQVRWDPDFTVRTRSVRHYLTLVSDACIPTEGTSPMLRIGVDGRSDKGGWLIASVRPYNPEGVSFIEDLSFDRRQSIWRVNKKTLIAMDKAPDRVRFSDFRRGDVYHRIFSGRDNGEQRIHCELGLATTAAAFRLDGGKSTRVQLSMPMAKELQREFPSHRPFDIRTTEKQRNACKADLPDERMQFLFDNAVHTLMMLSAGEIYPGPYTYKRFWFRDGCLMVNALLSLGEEQRVHRLLDGFVRRQNRDGYFRSQEGEWDSNGQVLWILGQYRRVSGQPLPHSWARPILKAARWILAKRTPPGGTEAHAGLLPAGFSAEHLGPNDYYFWDDFWSVAGLKAAADLIGEMVSAELGEALSQSARRFENDLFDCIEAIDADRRSGGIPASPYRRMDAGAIGSMVADYPLQLTPPGDPRIQATLEHLLAHHFVKGGFFQDMIHSGINAYLTLDLAQTLLRTGDARYRDLLMAVADLASPTGNWPEAVHPSSGGGCMGDGQHGWAAAEWIMMIRNMFVREEQGRLIVGSGVLPQWLDRPETTRIRFGPTLTSQGAITVYVDGNGHEVEMRIDADDRSPHRGRMDVMVPGFESLTDIDIEANRVIRLERSAR